jgi:hypothetical protein
LDFEEYESEREYFAIKYSDIALIAVVNQPNGGEALFGPFKNGLEAMDWFLTVPVGVRVFFVPLRRPEKKRVREDFYLPEHMLAKDEYSETV